jgi:hypothetical protein
MALESFARASLAQFTTIYAELYDGKAIDPSELETKMWARICAKDAGISKLAFKINFDNIKRSKVTLPYMPDDINYIGCPCIKKNGGLYTPCCAKVGEDAEYCKSCSIDKEGNEKPLEFGVLADRAENIENGLFSPMTYGEWMRAKKTSLPEIYKKLAEAGIQLEIPSAELFCRAVAKNRKGRPAKDTDSAEDEDSPVKPKKPRAKAPKSSPKSSPKASPKTSPHASDDSESESEDEVAPPTPPIKAKKAKAEDEPKKPKKPKAEAKSEDEPKKPKKPKAEAKSDEDEPKKPKAEAKSDEDEPKKPKAEAKSDEDEPKAKKVPKAKAEDEPKKPKAKKPKTPEPEEPAEEEAEEGEEEEDTEEVCEVDGKDYTLKNQKYICDIDDGTILGTIVRGKVTWSGERR